MNMLLQRRFPGRAIGLIAPAVMGLLFAARPVAAQTAAPSGPALQAERDSPAEVRALSLDEALEIATQSSEQVDVAQAAVLRARGEQWRARSARLPQIRASVDYSRALASEFEGLGGAPDSASADLLEGLGDLPFGSENTYRFGVTVSQNVFAGGRISARNRIANAGRELAEIALTSARAQLVLDVARAYYDAVLSDRLLAIAEATLQQAQATLDQTQLAHRVGDRPEFDLLRAQVARDNQRPVVIRRRSDRDLAYLQLKQLLDLPLDGEIDLTTDLDDTGTPALTRFTAQGTALPTDTAVGTRAPVRRAEQRLRIQENLLRTAKSQRLPDLIVSSQFGRVAYPSVGLPGWNDFRSNWTVGVGVQIPIFTGGQIRGDELVAEAELAEAQAQHQLSVELATLDSRRANQELEAAEAAWEASKGTVEQATHAYEIAEVRFQEGISTQVELSDSRILLQQAQANRALAARELQLARVRVALLPYLPLGIAEDAAQRAGGGDTAQPQIPEQPRAGPVPRRPQASASTFGFPGGGVR